MGSVIRFLAIATSAIVLLSFGLFVVDQMDEGSKTQQRALDGELGHPVDANAVSPTPVEERARETQQSPAHELVDDANDVLVAPFGVLIDSGNNWVQHGVSTLLALLIYGIGLGFVANLLPKQRSHGRDWRAAQS